MLNKTVETTEKKNYVVRGSSVVENASSTNTTICTMYTAFDTVDGKIVENGVISISQTIINSELYKANKEQCRQDFNEFSDYVDSLIEGETTEEE